MPNNHRLNSVTAVNSERHYELQREAMSFARLIVPQRLRALSLPQGLHLHPQVSVLWKNESREIP